MNPSIDAILMASGYSRRFGEKNKLLQPLNGRPIVSCTLQLVCQSQLFNQIYFVAADPQVIEVARAYPVQVIHNASPQRGACESVRLGTAASQAEHYMFFTCDMPLLDAATLQALVSHAQTGYMVFPTHEGEFSSPSIFSARYRDELLSLADHEAPRIIRENHPDRVIGVEVADGRRLLDIDTPEDLKKILEMLEAPP